MTGCECSVNVMMWSHRLQLASRLVLSLLLAREKQAAKKEGDAPSEEAVWHWTVDSNWGLESSHLEPEERVWPAARRSLEVNLRPVKPPGEN